MNKAPSAPAKRQCYRCAAEGTTREHFPPKCFFPKGSNLQLKTVCSCELHNNKKSNDNQYLLAHICMNAAKDNNLAKRRFLESIVPQLNEKPALKRLLAGEADVLPGGAVDYKVDVQRFNNFFDSLTCAIYYKHFGRQFSDNTHSMEHIYMSLHSEDHTFNAEVEFANTPIKSFF